MVMRYLVVFLFLVIPGGVAYAQSSSQMLEMQQQLTRLENEVRQLRGKVERLSHENKRLKNQQNDLYTDLDQRLRAIQAGAPANQLMVETVVPTTPTTVTMPPVAGTVPTSPQHSRLAIGGQPPSVSQPVTSMPVSVVCSLVFVPLCCKATF